MILLEVLNGTKAGTRWEARRLPFGIGRGKHAALSLPDNGIWESHAEMSLRRAGCFLSARPEALTLVNGNPVVDAVRLRNGDLIEIGSVSMRFGLGPTRQRSQAWREYLVWLAITLLCLGQIALIYRVLP